MQIFFKKMYIFISLKSTYKKVVSCRRHDERNQVCKSESKDRPPCMIGKEYSNK